jgi:hypothetical protein
MSPALNRGPHGGLRFQLHGTTCLPVMGPSGAPAWVGFWFGSLTFRVMSVDVEVNTGGFREVGVIEVGEVLRAWMAGGGRGRSLSGQGWIQDRAGMSTLPRLLGFRVRRAVMRLPTRAGRVGGGGGSSGWAERAPCVVVDVTGQ